MKNILKKLTISMFLVITIMSAYNFIFNTENSVQAIDDFKQLAENEGVVGAILDGLVGIVLYIPKAMAYAIIKLVEVIVSGIAAIGGMSTGSLTDALSIKNIIFTGARVEGFSGIDMVSVDFFNFSNTNTTISALRQNVATWYYALRNLSIVILLGILLYVGIRMAISTVADEKARYKKMIKDWVVSLALVFVLHFIMIFIIEINNTLVTIMYNADLSSNWGNAIGIIEKKVWDVSFSVGVGSLVVYGILVGVTIIYLIMYIKRMLTVAFLIIISPLITITYSIDKMGDGKSQALNTWLKEFSFNILIQPFHCIIYVVFVNTAVNLMTGDSAQLSSSILAIIMILFMHKAEEIVKQIFHFQSSSLASAIGSTAALTAGLSFMQKQGGKAAKKDVNTKKIPNMDSSSKGGEGTSGSGKQAGKGQSNVANNNMNASNESNDGSGGGNSALPQGSNGGQVQQPQDWWHRDIDKDFIKDAGKTAGRNIKNTAKSVPGKLKNAGVNMIKNSPKNALRLAGYMALGTIAAATGGKGISAGLYAANAIDKGISAKLNRRQANKIVESNEQKFAGAYRNFQEKTGKSDAEMETFTKQMLDGDVDASRMSEDEYEDYRQYSSYVRKMQSTYRAVGEDNVEDRMLDTIAMINDGTIEPEYIESPQIIEGGQNEASPQLEQQAEQTEQPIVIEQEGNFEQQVEKAKHANTDTSTNTQNKFIVGTDGDLQQALKDKGKK